MSAPRPLRVGTRSSALALTQAGTVAARLGPAELVTISTGGDRGTGPSDKSRWVDAIETALIDGEIDVAVHSAKDVPGELAPGLEIVAVPTRADARDALCGASSLAALPAGARVGTASLRRRAALLAARPDLEIVDLRGNVDTRLHKLAAGAVDALVLAGAGLARLEREDAIGALLDLDEIVPAPGQGALAIEARRDDVQARAAAATIGDDVADACLRAERALVSELGATCRTPVGAHATHHGASMTICAFVGLPDGSTWLRDRVEQSAGDPEQLGRACAQRMLDAGAAELLDQAETMAATG